MGKEGYGLVKLGLGSVQRGLGSGYIKTVRGKVDNGLGSG